VTDVAIEIDNQDLSSFDDPHDVTRSSHRRLDQHVSATGSRRAQPGICTRRVVGSAPDARGADQGRYPTGMILRHR